MVEVRWEYYPLVAEHERARKWLQIQANLQLAPTTIDAYGRSLNDFIHFCIERGIQPEEVTREQVALYVQDLATRPNPKGAKILSIESGRGLSNSTMQLRITVLRLFCDALVEEQLRQDNPVGRGHYVAGKGFGGTRDRGLIPHYQKLPWLPSDEEWQTLLKTLKTDLLRNQVMLLLAYEGALRREELVTLAIGDFDFAYRQMRVRAEHAKNGAERVVGYGKITEKLLEAYLQQRRTLSTKRGPLFLSESRRNRGHPLSLVMWSKAVQAIANRSQIPQFTTHTPRHLRLTHLARAHLELHQIALYAGHRSLQTTMRYIHLSGVELTIAVSRSLAGFEQWMDLMLGDQRS
ncbi:integrase [Reticulibacter mediterranei]|uniref:Integrase n=1 Tax=Reticulibacter mediterranei TaxID=2778369 RepID=A0A8J3IFD8_9CHLR|nr:site-specific integrase [Reticulibacter mediterranei]GHO91505.1 integrase [Reticulibacter mediterranei]